MAKGKITHYTTCSNFGTRPVLMADEVRQRLGLDHGEKLPETFGRFWAVRRTRGNAA